MGTWGYEIYDEDIAVDVRNQFLNLIEEKEDGSQAIENLISAWEGDLNDPDIYPVFWTALSATQLELKQLDDRVKKETLKIIDSGVDLDRWKDDPDMMQKRKDVLTKLKNRLKGFQSTSPKKEVKPRKPKAVIGDIFVIPLADGRDCYGQYLLNHNLGIIICVFDFITNNDDEVDTNKILKANLLFPPVKVLLPLAIEDGTWYVIGNVLIKKFKFPKFLWGVRGKNWDEIISWSLYDGKERKLIGSTLP